MTKTQKYYYATIISGTLTLLSYFLTDYFCEILWIFCLLPLSIFGLTFLTLLIRTIINKNKKGILVGIFFIIAISVAGLLDSELFKSKKVLEASLINDLSAVHLTLRENNKFEVIASSLSDDQTFIGDYKIEGNKIIFKDKNYSNDFIPDTLTIIGNKMICCFDKNGNPITDFATFFEIKKNILKKEP